MILHGCNTQSTQHHFERDDSHDRDEDQAQRFVAQASHQSSPQECSQQDTQCHRSSYQRRNIATREVNARAGSRRHADHKVAGRGGDLHGQSHRCIHCQHLKGATADAEQSGDDACQIHHRQTKRCAGHLVGNLASQAFIWVRTRETQPGCQAIILHSLGQFLADLEYQRDNRYQQNDPKEHKEQIGSEQCRQERTCM